MIKPAAPIIRTPIAATFAIDLNSEPVGFLKTCHTRFDCKKNDFNFPSIFVL